MSFEGPLSKWTNVIQGWQYRYFVVDANEGALIYYTSKENLLKQDRRGVVSLRDAHLGIDSEDDNTFTIRSAGKTFHFQARDAEERQKWISNLEDAISLNTVNIEKFSFSNATIFEQKIGEADALLRSLIEQVNELELNNQQQECHKRVVLLSKKLIETVKYSIISLQLAKKQMNPSSESTMEILNDPTISTTTNDAAAIETENSCLQRSYSVSDDGDFCDADEPADDLFFSPSATTNEPEIPVASSDPSEISFEAYEAAYEYEPEEELAPIDGTIISHLISQARISMDLTKITLPTFILERRSFLEMLADFLAHPDEFVNITNYSTPRDRFVQVVKWYLSAFHAGRKSPVPKKPYNPILGETFQCTYDVDGPPSDSKNFSATGPVPWASDNQVSFLAEQTSHHPPIASFYAECPTKRIQVDGCLWTKSKFLGLSVGVHMIGQATLTVIDHDEHYVMTFPSAYGRSILGAPWFEMGGKVSIDCEKTGFSAIIEFLTKPFYNGKKHQIVGTLFGPDKKEFAKIDGEWNGTMNIKYGEAKTSEIFFDTKSTNVVKKIVRPLVEQNEYESRRLWKDVTYNLKYKQLDKATKAKSFLEQRQRQQAKERAEQSLNWKTKHFAESGQKNWTFENQLTRRLAN